MTPYSEDPPCEKGHSYVANPPRRGRPLFLMCDRCWRAWPVASTQAEVVALLDVREL